MSMKSTAAAVAGVAAAALIAASAAAVMLGPTPKSDGSDAAADSGGQAEATPAPKRSAQRLTRR